MARLQVLHLPAPENEYPFALVLDGLTENEMDAVVSSERPPLWVSKPDGELAEVPPIVTTVATSPAEVKHLTGARAVLCFTFPVEVV